MDDDRDDTKDRQNECEKRRTLLQRPSERIRVTTIHKIRRKNDRESRIK